jgi:hypothetical protein
MAEPSKRYVPKLEEVSLQISELSCRCWTWPVPRTQSLAGLIRFAGLYGRGSAGKDDALFIKWRIAEFSELRLPSSIDGLVVDLRELDYEWGDDLTINVGRLADRHEPLLAVIDPARIVAFGYVIREDQLRTDAEIAFAEVADRIRAPRSPPK